MLREIKNRLGEELERLSQELTGLMPAPTPAVGEDAGRREVRQILQRRIRFLGQLVAGLAAVDPGDLWPDRAGFGSVVRLRELAGGKEVTYTLTTGDLIELEEGQVSLASPVGNALLGRRPGETVTVATPRGERRYQILDLITLPQKLGLVPLGPEAPGATGSLQVA